MKLCCLVLFSWRKMEKWKKLCSTFQNLLHHISKTGTLQNSIRLQLSFFDHFWQLVMWPPSQHPIAWTLTDGIIIILFFFTSWSNQVKFHFLDGRWSKVPASHTPFIFFSDVLVIIWLFLDRLPHLELGPGPWKQYPPSSPPPILFSFFSYFLAVKFCTIFPVSAKIPFSLWLFFSVFWIWSRAVGHFIWSINLLWLSWWYFIAGYWHWSHSICCLDDTL